jgi:hypothetical protein
VPIVHLRVDPVFCGPASVGTVELIKLIRECFGLSLADAKAYVDRCVFAGEDVAIPTESLEVAAGFAQDAIALRTPARIFVQISPG